MISVLLVGPEVAGLPALRVTSELLRVGDLREVALTALVGPEVTLARLLDRLERGRCEVLLWSGHGTPAALLLSGGGSVRPQWLAGQLAERGVRLAVLAACESGVRPETAELSLGFQDVLPAAGVSLVAMRSEISDQAAIEYDVALLQSLAAGATIRAAHVAGLEAAALAGSAAAPQLFAGDGEGIMTSYAPSSGGGDSQLLRSMSDKIDRLSEQVNTINTKQVLLDATLTADVRHIREDVAVLRSDVTEWRQGSFSLPKTAVGVLSLIMLVSLLVLVVMTWRAL